LESRRLHLKEVEGVLDEPALPSSAVCGWLAEIACETMLEPVRRAAIRNGFIYCTYILIVAYLDVRRCGALMEG
jgi:hypothetical protein